MRKLHFCPVLGVALCMTAATAMATENGADSYPLGAEGVATGALPPPGAYLLLYYENYHAARFNDKHGKSSTPGFGINIDAVVPRLIWVTPETVAGARLGFSVAASLVDLRLSLGGQTDQRRVMGDTLPAVFLSWHNGNQHWVTAMEAVLPTGDYDKNQLANAGRNYYTLRPLVLYSYHQPNGWDISTKASYSFNSTNRATHYRSGQYFAADYSVGYEVVPRWTAALQGHVFKQSTSDEVKGDDIGFRGQEVAWGPGVHYQGNGWSLEGKYLKETAVENRPMGNSTWLKLVWSF